MLRQHHRHRIDFLPRRAPHHPDPHGLARLLAHEQRGHQAGQRLELLAVTEEAAHRDEEVTQQRLTLPRIRFQQRNVVRQGVHVVETKPPVQAPQHHRSLVQAEIVPRAAPQRREDRRQPRVRLTRRLRGSRRLVPNARLLPAQADQLPRHAPARQHQVDQTRSNGTHRHGIVFGVFRRLRHRDPARTTDVADSSRSIAAGARQHHPHRVRAERLRQRAEEEIHRRVIRSLPAIPQHHAVPDHRQIMARRNDVDVIRGHPRRPHHLRHRDRRPVLEQLRHPALPRRIQVQDHHERQPAVRRHRLHELLQRLQTPRRCPDPHHQRWPPPGRPPASNNRSVLRHS